MGHLLNALNLACAMFTNCSLRERNHFFQDCAPLEKKIRLSQTYTHCCAYVESKFNLQRLNTML